MKRVVLEMVTMLLSGLLSAVSAADTSEVTGARAVDEAWRSAIMSNNLEAIVACYAPDAVLLLPDAPLSRGTDAIRRSYADLLARSTIIGAEFRDTHYETRGDLSEGWGSLTLILLHKTKTEVVNLKARFAVVAMLIDGRWKYLVDHASSEPQQADGTPSAPPSHAGLSEIPDNIEPPVRVSMVNPQYPAKARRAGQQGRVVLQIIVTKAGDVESPRVIESNPVFDDAAVDAVIQWKYKPALQDGKPVRSFLTVIVEFNLHEQK